MGEGCLRRADAGRNLSRQNKTVSFRLPRGLQAACALAVSVVSDVWVRAVVARRPSKELGMENHRHWPSKSRRLVPLRPTGQLGLMKHLT